MVRVDNLAKVYCSGVARQVVFEALSFGVERGEVVALLGASGSGKTTLLNLISGIDSPDSGSVRLDGVEVTALAEPERTLLRRRRIGFVFQFFNLIPTLTVGHVWLLLLTLLVVACEGDGPASEATLSVAQALGSEADAGFARALQPRAFRFPEDHGAHPEFATEWWYLTGNLHSENGRRFGYQFTLFRVGLRPGEAAPDSAWRTQQIYMGHIAISDVAAGRHHSAERFARAAAGLAGASASPFAVWLGAWSLRGGTELFPLVLSAGNDDIGLSLQLQAGGKPLVLQGEDGLSRKSARPGNPRFRS